MDQTSLIEVTQLTRRYGSFTAVDDIGFKLERGEVLGFLGPNGAGKSTTMQMLTGNLAPSAGRIRINGVDLLDDPQRAKAQIGYLPEQPPLYRDLTVDEYLRYCAQLHRVPRARLPGALAEAKRRSGLTDTGTRLIANLSKGYRQRVGIAQAIIHDPAVVILDEPTVGLDPIQIREIRDLIRELGNSHGVILSTHILPEVQSTCDRVQIINIGRLVFSDRLDALTGHARSTSMSVGLERAPDDAELGALPGIGRIERLDDGRLRLHAEYEAVGEDWARTLGSTLAERAAQQSWGLYELAPEYRSPEQVFVDITSGDASPLPPTQGTESDSGESAAS